MPSSNVIISNITARFLDIICKTIHSVLDLRKLKKSSLFFLLARKECVKILFLTRKIWLGLSRLEASCQIAMS